MTTSGLRGIPTSDPAVIVRVGGKAARLKRSLAARRALKAPTVWGEISRLASVAVVPSKSKPRPGLVGEDVFEHCEGAIVPLQAQVAVHIAYTVREPVDLAVPHFHSRLEPKPGGTTHLPCDIVV